MNFVEQGAPDRCSSAGLFVSQIIGEQFVSVLRSTLETEGSWDDQTELAWQKLFRVGDADRAAIAYTPLQRTICTGRESGGRSATTKPN